MDKSRWPHYVSEEKLNHFISEALGEDVGNGDHSTLSCIPEDKEVQAKLWVKEDCVLAGVDLAKYIFHFFDPALEVESLMQDGQEAKKGDISFYVSGSARSILTTERLVLNCMQRMSGIASKTASMAKRIAHTQTKLLDTRKTTPNFRICEKWAVQIGGGRNHRYGLYDMIMLKDNHVDYSGGISGAVEQTKKYLKVNKLDLKIELETRNLDEVKEALEAGVDRIMLDNMSCEMMQEAVVMIGKKCETEASGGITEDMLESVADTGVDFISVGALTHSAKNIDLSLKAG